MKLSTKFFLLTVGAIFSPIIIWRLFNWYTTFLDDIGRSLGWSDCSIEFAEYMTFISAITLAIVAFALKIKGE
jgi:hypothetical protein